MTASNDKYIGMMLDGRYEILEKIGEGGMALVYKAFCHRLSRYVAVKIMREELISDQEFRRRFCSEAHAIAMLSHPNIVAVYDVSHSEDIEYLVMELVDGITLKQYMERRGTLNWKEVVHFSKQICKALSHAHSRGIIHRDIKPQNILLLKDGTIKVADFGIAALENEMQENKGQAIGSIHYIAPEQARCECPDARSDIYSLGVVMYEMLTGAKPYTGDTLGEIAVKRMSAPPPSPADLGLDVPQALIDIVLKAMAPDIALRYQTAAELLEALDAFTAEQIRAEENPEYENPNVVPVRSVSELPREKYHRRRRRSSTVAFMTGVFGGLMVLLFLFVFLWKFWLGDVFSPAERIALPNFVGSNYEDLSRNAELASMYSFKPTYVVDTQTPKGVILSQNPDPGRSMMITSEGIKVELSVSTGVVLVSVPDVSNIDYREATTQLKDAGFEVEVENATSPTIAKNYVIRTSPAANEQISAGSKIYITVSSGAQVDKVTVPNLIGLSEEAAMNKIASFGLTFGGSDRVTDDNDAGTVIKQSVAPFTEVDEHTSVFLTVSSGSWG